MTGVPAADAESALENVRWEYCSANNFDRFAAAWDELNNATSGSPALSAEFIAALLRELGTGREWLAVGYHGNTVQAVTVLRRKSIGFWETFQPPQAPLGAWIHRPPHTLASLVPGLLRALPGFAAALGITQQDPDLLRRPATSETVETLDYIESARVTIARTFDDYWARRGKNLRNNTKRQLHRLAKDGVALSLDCISDAADVAQAMEEYGRLESAGWKAAAGTAIHPANAQGRFYRAVLEAFCRRGAGRIYRYRYGDSIVAMDLCIESRDTLIILKTTYDESIRDSSPASLMRHAYFQHIFDEARIRRIEFYGKVMDWHTKWSDEIRVLYHANFYRYAAVLKARRRLRRQPAPAAASAVPPLPATAPTAAAAAPPAPRAAPTWRLYPASEFGSHIAAWQSILAQRPRSSVNEAAFVNAVVNVFARGDEVLAICGDPGAPYAMCILRHSAAGTWETFQPSQAPLSPWIHLPEVSFESVVPGLLKALPGMPLVVGITQKDPDIHPRPPDSANLIVLDYIETARILVNRPFDEYWQARDKKIKYEIRRRLKRLAEIGGEPRLDVLRDPGAIPAAIQEYGDMEASGWKGRAGTAVSGDNLQGEFYRTLLSEYCARGRGRIYRYCIGDRAIAMQLCIEDADSLVFLKTTFDENYRRYSPGILMKHAIFEHVFNEGKLKKIEFYGAFIEWQSKWSDDVRIVYHVNYYRWRWLAQLRNLRRLVGRRLKAILDAADDRDIEGNPGQQPAHVVTRYTDLSALPCRFNQLFLRAGNTGLYSSLPWYINFVQSVLAPNESLHIYAVDRTTTQPAACAALLLYSRDSNAGWFAPKTLNGLSNYYSSLFGPVVDPNEPNAQQILDTLIAGIARDKNRWDVIDMRPLDVNDPVFDLLMKAFRSAGMLAGKYFCFGNWYLNVNGQTFSEYLSTRPSRLSKTGKRQLRILQERGRFRFELFTAVKGLDRAIADYNAIYNSSWKEPEPHPNFLGGLIRTCAEQGWLRLGIAYMDGQPAAAQLWIVLNETALIYKMAYDQRFTKDSVGTAVSLLLMQHAIDVDKVKVVDYLTGDDTYKQDWMTNRRERWGIVAFNPRTPLGVVLALQHFGGNKIRKTLAWVRRLGAAKA